MFREYVNRICLTDKLIAFNVSRSWLCLVRDIGEPQKLQFSSMRLHESVIKFRIFETELSLFAAKKASRISTWVDS